MMQFHPILLLGFPPNHANLIEAFGKLPKRFNQYLLLIWGWVKKKFYRSVHTGIIPYTRRFCMKFWCNWQSQGHRTPEIAAPIPHHRQVLPHCGGSTPEVQWQLQITATLQKQESAFFLDLFIGEIA
jgi:hypothetical protein